VNKLSINIKKTNFMVITSWFWMKFWWNFEQKSYIKYFGIYISIKIWVGINKLVMSTIK
jgi:hypothetical protein